MPSECLFAWHGRCPARINLCMSRAHAVKRADRFDVMAHRDLKCGVLWAMCVALAAVLPLGSATLSTSTSLQLGDADQWVTWALAQQTDFQADVPLDKVVLPATRHSACTIRDAYFDSAFLVNSKINVLHRHVLSLSQQLALGIRRFVFQVHMVAGHPRICVGGSEVKAMCDTARASTALPAICEAALGLQDLGADTGCKASDALLHDALQLISSFLKLPGHTTDVVVVSLRDKTRSSAATVDEVVASTLGDLVFTPAHKVWHVPMWWHHAGSSWTLCMSPGCRC